uniref:Uncharacterized protein n=1 Tax=Magallana gigas TaxID=29159 RepID=K1QU79_MAGGI
MASNKQKDGVTIQMKRCGKACVLDLYSDSLNRKSIQFPVPQRPEVIIRWQYLVCKAIETASAMGHDCGVTQLITVEAAERQVTLGEVFKISGKESSTCETHRMSVQATHSFIMPNSITPPAANAVIIAMILNANAKW